MISHMQNLKKVKQTSKCNKKETDSQVQELMVNGEERQAGEGHRGRRLRGTKYYE